jgi:hypothetical protein
MVGKLGTSCQIQRRASHIVGVFRPIILTIVSVKTIGHAARTRGSSFTG